jgi:predicted PurR-regulated permease PerM
MSGGSFSITDVLSNVVKISANVLEGLVIMLISGIYLSAQPNLYRKGLISLFPQRAHRRAAKILDEIAASLRLWLIGQLIQMVVIGALSYARHVDHRRAVAACAWTDRSGRRIRSYLGPILAAIPAILVALTKGQQAALWTLFAYIAIHQIEGNLVIPLVQQRHLVSIPPAVMPLGIVAITYLFGPIFIIFAAPMAVVIFVAVNFLYVHDTLGEETAITRLLE